MTRGFSFVFPFPRDVKIQWINRTYGRRGAVFSCVKGGAVHE